MILINNTPPDSDVAHEFQDRVSQGRVRFYETSI